MPPKKIELLSDITFLDEKNENLKNKIINILLEKKDMKNINSQMDEKSKKTINEINDNSNIQIILKNKSEQDISELLNELIQDHRDQGNFKKR